jgi:methionine-S-sulfoxide reductase
MHTTKTAIFAAGCFWGVQAYFDQVPGVTRTTVGYTGGHVPNPTYEQVCSHSTGHAEATKIEFDPSRISFTELLEHFFYMHDPTQFNRQGPDVGDEYRSAIFYLDDGQRHEAEAVIAKLANGKRFEQPIATQVAKASEFYPAESYHQKFFERTGYGACHVWPNSLAMNANSSSVNIPPHSI